MIDIKRGFLLLWGIVLGVASIYGQYSVQNLPNPKQNGQQYFVSNPDHVLSEDAVWQLDALSQEIDSLSQAEYAVVVVDDYEGDDDFEFALALFNHWGIGKKGADNGLLLFIAKDRREYRFISGYGMERIFPDAYLKRVGEKYLVPHFRADAYDEGVLEASQFIKQILTSPNSIAELEALMPEAIPFWHVRNPILNHVFWIVVFFVLSYIYIHIVALRILATSTRKKKVKLRPIAPIFWGMGCMLMLMFLTIFVFAFVLNNVEDVYQVKNLPYFVFIFCAIVLGMKLTDSRTAIIKTFLDAEDLQHALKKFLAWAFIPMLISPLAWFDLIGTLRRFSQNSGRFTPPDDREGWVRVNRSKGVKGLLDKGQRKEEDLKSVRYEIWQNTKVGERKLVPWDKDSKFSECPECHYRTLRKSRSKTVKAATYSSTGQGEKFDKCDHCSYYLHISFYTIARKSKSSGGSGSGGSSGGGRSSSSSSGSFGGGSSGGGGAGGRW